MSSTLSPLVLLFGFSLSVFASPAQAVQELQASNTDVRSIPELAWQLHQAQPSSQDLLAQWQQAQDPQRFLVAAARGLRGQPELNALVLQALPSQGELPPTAEMLELLQAAPLDVSCIPRLRALQSNAIWREASTLALLKAGVGAAALNGFPVLLESALQQGWRPAAEVCGEFFEDGTLRARMWPALVGESLSREHGAALRALDTRSWPDGDRLLLEVLLADVTGPSAETADRLWQGWLNTPLPEAAGVALQDALARHLPWADANRLRATWQAAPEQRQRDGWTLLSMLAPPPAALMLRELALDDEQDSALRARAVNAVMRCGSDVDVQAVAGLLRADTPQPILQSLFAGMRIRAASGIATPLESMMPRLRTRLAALAIELIVIHGSEDARLRWLGRLGPLSQSDQVRIVQAAWASAPSDALLDWFRAQAASSEAGAALRGRVGLQAALSPKEAADFYRAQFEQASSVEQRQAVLRSVRELRNDAALEVIVDWLESAEGRRHPSSASWASLLIEEPLAARAFRIWWQDPNSLSTSQADAAASNLASESSSARSYVRKRIPLVEAPQQVRMLTALIQAPQAEDASLVFALYGKAEVADPVRSRAAQIAGALAAEDEELALHGWTIVLEASNQLATPARDHRAFVRAWAQEAADAEAREHLLARIETLPAIWQQLLTLECGLGEAANPHASSASSAADGLIQRHLRATHAANDENAASAEASLRREQPLLFAALAILGAQSSPEIDARLTQGLADLSAWHPDALAIVARSLETKAPMFFAAARERLLATESLDSWRRPPEPARAMSQPFWTLKAQDCYQVLQDGLLGESPPPRGLIDAVAKRWPRDRRSHLWPGWYALREASLAEARAAFERADACSGWLPYARMEPRLGLALCSWREDGKLQDLRALIATLPQVSDLLPHRLDAQFLRELKAALES